MYQVLSQHQNLVLYKGKGVANISATAFPLHLKGNVHRRYYSITIWFHIKENNCSDNIRDRISFRMKGNVHRRYHSIRIWVHIKENNCSEDICDRISFRMKGNVHRSYHGTTIWFRIKEKLVAKISTPRYPVGYKANTCR